MQQFRKNIPGTDPKWTFRTVCGSLPVRPHNDVVYNRFQFIKQVAGNQNGCIRICRTEDTLDDLIPSYQVDAVQRFVQHTDVSISCQCCGNF